MLLFVYFIVGLNSARAWFPQFARSPADAWPGLLLLMPLAYGIPRFLASGYLSWGQRDALLALRALVKIGVGAVGSWFLLSNNVARELGQNLGTALLWLAPVAAGFWCVTTGIVRFLLL